MTNVPEVRVRLRKPLERSVHAGHPWLYRDALLPFEADPGTIARVEGKGGRFLARGIVDAGPIGVRVFTTGEEALDASLFARRITQAFQLRARLVPAATNAYRLLHGEGDRLPGVVLDRYADAAVLKLDGEGITAFRERLLEWLRGPLVALGIQSLLVRLPRGTDQKARIAWGDSARVPQLVVEHGMQLAVDLFQGQKTGLFLDHRESRHRVRQLARSLAVLNLYGYTGGFSVAAGLGGARSVTTVDSARAALELAERSWAANALPTETHTATCGDVPQVVAELADSRRRFGLVIADPPSFAPRATAKDAALESYAELHHRALGLVEPGGYYLAASCSSHVTRTDFEASLREGSRRARRALQVLETWGAPADHPRPLAFPEGDYLKVVLLRAP